ncbi:hypothetical protein J5N97_028351 [Dioscorea zingiberensis]|uniref:Uncharacterized protein n=1 Tax=Dioscorea zingiberensis TaxID=325984 RepID=A0A9D5H4Q7_9LILI|nr:hypothetical protein J5N97_028351 [Dioscorea zingiberensis]
MDRVSERDRSSRKSRDDHDRDRDRDRDHQHRHHHHSEKHADERRHRSDGDRRHRSTGDSAEDLDERRERSVERARVSRDDSKKHRERSAERGSFPREESVERRHSYSRKRKDQNDEPLDESEKSGKKIRVSEGVREDRRERRRFEDHASEDGGELNGVHKERRKEKTEDMVDVKEDSKRSRVKEEVLSDAEERKTKRRERKFSDSMKVEGNKEGKSEFKEEQISTRRVKDEDLGSSEDSKPGVSVENSKNRSICEQVENGVRNDMDLDKSGSVANVDALAPFTVAPKVSVTSSTSHHPLPTKVSSITTTNENEGVSVSRSDEVPGKSSTDGTTTSVAGKSGSLSLDALAKAKKALQMRKELSEKLKKIPALNKLSSASSANNSQGSSSKDQHKIHSTPGTQFGPSVSAVPTFAAPVAVSSTQTLPVGATASVNTPGVIPGLTTVHNLEAVKRAQELAARMGFHQDPEFAPLINMFPGPSTMDIVAPQRPSKTPVLRLDAQGREIDEHGNVVNMPKLTNLSTLKVNINKQKKEAFQILRPEFDANTVSSPHFDAKMGMNMTKLLRPKRMTFQFVEEGKWSKQAEMVKFKSQFGEAQAKELKIKQSQLAKAKAEPDINPNLIQVSDRAVKERKEQEVIPEIEWWDATLLPLKTYVDASNDKLNMEKITIYVEHPRPIEPPAEPAPPPPQPLKLTKKEQKKLRTQRRLAKERDRQEMIRQGLLEPPKPKIKMSNLMKVLGSEATQDPTKLEMEIRSAAAEREQAHVDRNIARKLTPAERREKKERKLFEDPNTLESFVSIYKINDLSHPQTRFKVDVNAQENKLTGCAVITDGMSIVVVEGGKKPIKRYGKLMLNRIKWATAFGDEEEGNENHDRPINSCVLVWQGSVAKPSFRKFIVHQCRSEAAGRKVFADAGVPHYWDLAVNFSEDLS